MDEQGLNDAAVLLMSLGEEEAAEVFKHLSPKEVQKLGETIARMRTVSHERVTEVVSRFSNEAAAQSLLVSDTSNYVRAVLRRALGDDKAALLIDRILQGGDVSGIESLKWMDRWPWPSCCATNIRKSSRPSWCIWIRTTPPISSCSSPTASAARSCCASRHWRASSPRPSGT